MLITNQKHTGSQDLSYVCIFFYYLFWTICKWCREDLSKHTYIVTQFEQVLIYIFKCILLCITKAHLYLLRLFISWKIKKTTFLISSMCLCCTLLIFIINSLLICEFVATFLRAVGTFARALDCSSSVRQPSLHMSAAAASRDITLVSRTHFVALDQGLNNIL